MWDQEKEHLRLFSNLILERRVRPTVLLPIWNVAGYALGICKLYINGGQRIKNHRFAVKCKISDKLLACRIYSDIIYKKQLMAWNTVNISGYNLI